MSNAIKKLNESWSSLKNGTAVIEVESAAGLWYLHIQPELQGLHETSAYFWTATLNPWCEPQNGGDDGDGFFRVRHGLEDDMTSAMQAAETIVACFDAASDDNVIPFFPR